MENLDSLIDLLYDSSDDPQYWKLIPELLDSRQQRDSFSLSLDLDTLERDAIVERNDILNEQNT